MIPRLSLTFSLYLAKRYAKVFFITLLVFAALIFLLDLLELLRRSTKADGVGLGILTQLSLLKLPTMLERLLPFVALFSTLITFWRLNRSQELMISRATGISVWQVMLPILTVLALISFVRLTVFNPVAAAMQGRYEMLDHRYLRGQNSLLAVSANGLWLREVEQGRDLMIHAGSITANESRLTEVIFFLFDADGRFIQRYDALSADLQEQQWLLTDGWLTAPNTPPQRFTTTTVPTTMTLERIQDSFASPDSLSMYELPGFIAQLERSGFSALRHRLYWYSQLASPLLLCALAMVAVCFTLHPPRRGQTAQLIVAGAFCGLLTYVLGDLINALSLAERMPVILAVLSIPVLTLLAASTWLLQREEG